MSVSDICVTKDYNRNVLRFTVPCDHPALDASRVMRAQSGSPGVAAGPVPSWILTIGSMVVVPSGPAHSDTMVNLAKKAIAEAEQAGEHRHASALRALGTQAVQHAKSTRTQHTTQLKASFVEYAAAARRQEHLRSQARMLTASKRQARFFVVGEVVRTRFGAGRLVEHRVHNDMCIVDLSFGRASVPRAELFPIDDGQDAFRPVIDADTLANGAGGSCGSASVPRGAAGGVSAPAGSPEPQRLMSALNTLAMDREGLPTRLEHQCVAAAGTAVAQAVLHAGAPVRATAGSLHRLANLYRHRCARSAAGAPPHSLPGTMPSWPRNDPARPRSLHTVSSPSRRVAKKRPASAVVGVPQARDDRGKVKRMRQRL